MRIEAYDDTQKPVWDEFVSRSKNGTFLFLRGYLDYHRDRFEDHSLLIRDDKERLIALLPANREGEALASHGGLTYGGFVTDGRMKTPLMLEVFEHTLAYLKENAFTRLVYKSVPYIYHKTPAEEDRYALFLCQAQCVRRGVLTVVSTSHRLPFQKRRVRGIRKALRNGLVTQESHDFEAYWSILTEVLLARYNTTPVHSLLEIELLRSRFPENIRLFACYHGEEILAGVVIYESERVAHVQYIASNEQGRALGALDLVFDFLLTKVYAHKPYFDFGTSDEDNGHYLNKGLIDQKEGFGARAITHDHYEIPLWEWEPGWLQTVMESSIERRAHGPARMSNDPTDQGR